MGAMAVDKGVEGGVVSSGRVMIREVEGMARVKVVVVEGPEVVEGLSREEKLPRLVWCVTRTTSLPSVTPGGQLLPTKLSCLLRLSISPRKFALGAWNLVTLLIIALTRMRLAAHVEVISIYLSA